MNKPHKHADLIHAYADGAEIQWRENPSKPWDDDPDPCFNCDGEFRIKPKTIKREGWINLWSIKDARTYGVIGVGGNIFDSEERAKEHMIGGATIKVEWEEEVE